MARRHAHEAGVAAEQFRKENGPAREGDHPAALVGEKTLAEFHALFPNQKPRGAFVEHAAQEKASGAGGKCAKRADDPAQQRSVSHAQ